MPNIPNRAILHARLDEILDSRRLTNDGPFVRRFEAQLAAMTGATHVVAMCNATLAMQVLFRALGLSGEAIMPSFTFVATAHAATWEGVKPVFVDVDSATHTIAARHVLPAITPRTQAIVGVHLWGSTCDVDPLQQVADKSGIPLIFDAAHALGCTYRGRSIGQLGTASVLSFHATKVAQSLEGGAVLTNDAALAAKLRLMRNFGFQTYDKVACLGTNAKLNEVAASFGLGCLEEFDTYVEVNRQNSERYQLLLADIPGLRFYEHDRSEKTNWQYLLLQIDPAVFPLSRDELVQALHAERVLARKYFSPGCHRMPPYSEWRDSRPDTLHVTNQLANELMTLPTGTGVNKADIEIIGSLIRRLQAQASEVRQALRQRRNTLEVLATSAVRMMDRSPTRMQ